MQATKIYVISLKRLPERRKSMETQLSKLGLEAEFVEAVDGLELSEATIKANYNYQGRDYTDPRRMTPTEIGCAWSHRNVYKRLIDSDEKYALVLEDDTILAPGIVPFLELIPKIPSDWELISLHWSNLIKMRPYIPRRMFPLNLYNQHKLELGSQARKYRLGEAFVTGIWCRGLYGEPSRGPLIYASQYPDNQFSGPYICQYHSGEMVSGKTWAGFT